MIPISQEGKWSNGVREMMNIIIPVLRGIDFNIEPEDINDFSIAMIAYITTMDSNGADCFYSKVMTPKKLIKLLSDEKILSGRTVFIVNEPDMESNIKLLKAEINKFLPSCARETWEEVALAINCYLEWEYYDPACGICDFYNDTMKKLEDGTYSPNTLTIEEILLKQGISWDEYGTLNVPWQD